MAFEANWVRDPYTGTVFPAIHVHGTARNYVVDWGDGTFGRVHPADGSGEYGDNGSDVHRYEDGVYTVSVSQGANGPWVADWRAVIQLHETEAQRIVGTSDAEYVIAGSGDDFVSGSSGDDIIFGQQGDDRLVGGGKSAGRSDDDQLIGGYGDDILIGGAGDDRLQGETGVDRLRGGAARIPSSSYNRVTRMSRRFPKTPIAMWFWISIRVRTGSM